MNNLDILNKEQEAIEKALELHKFCQDNDVPLLCLVYSHNKNDVGSMVIYYLSNPKTSKEEFARRFSRLWTGFESFVGKIHKLGHAKLECILKPN